MEYLAEFFFVHSDFSLTPLFTDDLFFTKSQKILQH